MFAFSEIHNWQGRPAVKQILVFPSELLKTEFEKTFAERVEKDGIDKASDSNAGAVYKIRAVKNGSGTWDGSVRCGSSGELLLGHPTSQPTYLLCLTLTLNAWQHSLREAINMHFREVYQQMMQEVPVKKEVSDKIGRPFIPFGDFDLCDQNKL